MIKCTNQDNDFQLHEDEVEGKVWNFQNKGLERSI